MFQRDLVSRAIELTLFSSRLEGEQPSSLLVAAQVEEGKSMRVSHYASMDSVAYLADATAYGIVKEYLEELQKGRIAHLIIPELIRLLAREDSGALIAFLGELMEEGIKEIQTYATSFRLPTPVKAAVIACIAKGNLSSRMRHWNETGFLSRFFVVSYSYSQETAERVMDSIIGRETQPTTSPRPSGEAESPPTREHRQRAVTDGQGACAGSLRPTPRLPHAKALTAPRDGCGSAGWA